MRGNRLRAASCEYKKRRTPCEKQPKTSLVKTTTMRGGSLTRFRTDEWYAQQGKGLVTDLMRGGLQGLIRTRNPLKVPSNIKRGLTTGLTRGIKRKAEDVLKKEITKQAKKALSNKSVKDAVRVASALFPKQTKRARDILGV